MLRASAESKKSDLTRAIPGIRLGWRNKYGGIILQRKLKKAGGVLRLGPDYISPWASYLLRSRDRHYSTLTLACKGNITVDSVW